MMPDANSTAPTLPQGDTVGALIASGIQCLEEADVSYGHGTACAADEARWLVLWQLGLPLDSVVETTDHPGIAPEHTADDATDSPPGNAPQHPTPLLAYQPVAPAQQAAVADLFARRITTRQPAAYLTREAWLVGVPFYVDERAIVPRSFIAELLADGCIDDWLSSHTRHVLDLCTGNGSLACLAALAYPDVHVTGVDISPDALDVARINVTRHGLHDRVTLHESDGLRAAPGPWDLILCNPPYVNAASMARLPAEYRAEPALALAGGQDGMDFIRQLLADAPACMSADAVLVLEIGNERDHFEAAFPHLPVFWLPVSAGDDCVLLITRQALLQAAAESLPSTSRAIDPI